MKKIRINTVLAKFKNEVAIGQEFVVSEFPEFAGFIPVEYFGREVTYKKVSDTHAIVLKDTVDYNETGYEVEFTLDAWNDSFGEEELKETYFEMEIK